jgi:antitoxin ParD1/3/4
MTGKRNPQRDEAQKEKLRVLRDAIQEGLDSGLSELTMDDAWQEAERRLNRNKPKRS